MIVAIADGVVVLVLLHPICDFVFNCGCTPVWLGGSATCELMPLNVAPNAACPWCAMSTTTLTILVAGSWLGGILAGVGLHRLGLGWFSILGAFAVSALLLSGAALGTGIAQGFPQNLGPDEQTSHRCASGGPDG